MKKYFVIVKDSIKVFQNFDIQQIPRVENTQADTLARLAAGPLLDLHARIFFEAMEDPSIKESKLVLMTDDKPYWMDPLINYLHDRVLLTDRKEARKLRYQASRYVPYEDKLYKQSFSLLLLRCL